MGFPIATKESTVVKPLNGDKLAKSFREKAFDRNKKTLLMTRYSGSKQEKDLTLGTNCYGFGRIHHFRQIQDPTWIPNPLPIVPASSYLNIPPQKLLLAQVFQLAVCNWRCWYCF